MVDHFPRSRPTLDSVSRNPIIACCSAVTCSQTSVIGNRDRYGVIAHAEFQGLTRTRSSIFWGTRFGLGKRTVARGRAFVVSVQPSRRKRGRKSGTRSEGGSCIAVRGSPSKSSPGRSTPNFGDGSTTMGASRLQRSGPSRGMSANRWFAGLVGSIRSYAITGVGHGPG